VRLRERVFEEMINSLKNQYFGLTLLTSELEERLMKYSSINLNEKYKATVVEAGIIILPTEEKEEEKIALHEFIHMFLFYYECSPELAIAVNFPPAFVRDEPTRVLLSSYFSYLNEAMAYFTTIRMSDVIKIGRNEAWKFFYDNMNESYTKGSKLVELMLHTMYNDSHNFLDPLYVLSRYGSKTLNIYFNNMLGIKFSVDERSKIRENIISCLRFMRKNFEI
jgi:hypothetical protein